MGIESILGAVAAPLIGGLLGGSGGGSSQTTQNVIDPRMGKLLYGEDGNGGLLGDVSKWYGANKSGLNDQMVQGMNRQWNTLTDPNIAAGYGQMRNTGQALMQAPIAGNPFTQPGGYRTGQPLMAGQTGAAPSYNPSNPNGQQQSMGGYPQGMGQSGMGSPMGGQGQVPDGAYNFERLPGAPVNNSQNASMDDFQGQPADPNAKSFMQYMMQQRGMSPQAWGGNQSQQPQQPQQPQVNTYQQPAQQYQQNPFQMPVQQAAPTAPAIDPQYQAYLDAIKAQRQDEQLFNPAANSYG